MATDTTVNNLIINKLSKTLYDDILTKSDTELYLVPDIIDSVPTNGSSNYITSGAVYTALLGKWDKSLIETISGITLLAQPDKYYVGTNIGTLAVTLPTPVQGILYNIILYLETGASPSITFSGSPILYGQDFLIEANSKCEINIVWNGSSWIIAQLKILTV